jgi:protein-ribulosamine 3-kinase
MDPRVLDAIRHVLPPPGDISPGNMASADLRADPVGGGSINDTYRLRLAGDEKPSFFCKINAAARYPAMFEKESRGLGQLSGTRLIRVPKVIYCGILAGQQLLVLEWIGEGLRTKKFWEKFGEQLASLHRVSNTFFGLDDDNYMGALSQSNQPGTSWCDFLISQRLEPQLELAQSNHLIEGRDAKLFENLYKKLGEIFPAEAPSLLHGDLWSGNFLCDEKSMPVLIDPALYFGHRSMDLGMTTLFGGFDKSFYEAYHFYFPLDSNHLEQWEVSRLYPLLIHLNLFGKSYLADILHTIRSY